MTVEGQEERIRARHDGNQQAVEMLRVSIKDTPTCLHTMYAENQTKCKINIGNKYSQTKWLSG